MTYLQNGQQLFQNYFLLILWKTAVRQYFLPILWKTAVRQYFLLILWKTAVRQYFLPILWQGRVGGGPPISVEAFRKVLSSQKAFYCSQHCCTVVFSTTQSYKSKKEKSQHMCTFSLLTIVSYLGSTFFSTNYKYIFVHIIIQE